MTSIAEFEHNWSSVVAKYNLQNNNHVQGLYKIRKSWTPTYLRNYFFEGMTSTSISKSINAFIERFVSSYSSLKDFVKQVDLALAEIENGETHDKMIPVVYLPHRWCLDSLQRSSEINEVSMYKTTVNQDDILLDNLSDQENYIGCPPKSTPKGRPSEEEMFATQRGAINLVFHLKHWSVLF
ncbi:protein FAR1-related sequence 11 [Tanacetum coccineum]